MIHVEQHGPVRAIRLARSVFGRPIYWTAAYWVDGLLIDSGPPCTASALASSLASLGITQIVITHAHEDHIGGLAQLQRLYPHAAIYAPRGAIPAIENPALLRMPLFRRALWGMPRALRGVRSLDDVDDKIQTTCYTFRAVETPGHCPSHISLFEPNQRWLFCGDAFIGGKERAWPRDYELFGVVSSLRTMASLRPERLFPGSGRVRRTPLPDLHGKIGYYTKLAEQVAQRDATGATSAEIASSLLGDDARYRFWTGGRFSASNLVEACRSYNTVVCAGPLAPNGSTVAQADDPQEDTPDDLIGPPHARSTDYTL